MMFDGSWGWHSGWGAIVMWIGMALFWGGLATAIVLLARSYLRRPQAQSVQAGQPTRVQQTQGEETPEHIAARRYAEGEIDRQEFESMKRDLRRQ